MVAHVDHRATKATTSVCVLRQELQQQGISGYGTQTSWVFFIWRVDSYSWMHYKYIQFVHHLYIRIYSLYTVQEHPI